MEKILIMKNYSGIFMLLFTMAVLSGCGAIETIFKAGMAWAFFLVGLVIVIIIVIIARLRR